MDALRRFRDMIGALAVARELSRRDGWSRERLLEHQREAVTRLVRHAAAHSPFYRRHYAGVDLSGEIRLEDLPRTDKRLMLDNYDDFATDRRLTHAAVTEHVAGLRDDTYLFGEYRAVATTGTSGVRGYFVYDRAAWRMVLGNTLRWNRLLGLGPRLPFRRRLATIGADEPMHVTWRIPRSGDVGLYTILRAEATDPLRSIAERLQAFRPEAILAYPSVAALLAVEQIEGRLDIAPRVVSTHSEVLTDEMVEKMRRAWGISPFNHYGLSEEPHVAADCDRHEGLHVFEDTCLLEIVDEEYNPVPDGTRGAKCLVTNLYNLVQPLIRYEISDLLTRAPKLCSCGRPFAMLSEIGGRSEDMLRLPAETGEGVVDIPPLTFSMVVERSEAVRECTVTHSPERIEVGVVLRAGADEAALRAEVSTALTEMIRKAGAVPPPVEIRVVDSLARPRERMGKLRLVGAAPERAEAGR